LPDRHTLYGAKESLQTSGSREIKKRLETLRILDSSQQAKGILRTWPADMDTPSRKSNRHDFFFSWWHRAYLFISWGTPENVLWDRRDLGNPGWETLA
jgi:hypothetical protein